MLQKVALVVMFVLVAGLSGMVWKLDKALQEREAQLQATYQWLEEPIVTIQGKQFKRKDVIDAILQKVLEASVKQ